MKTFVDTTGQSWTIQLTINSVKRVRELLDVNLLDLMGGDPPLLTRLGTDIVLLCDVIFALVRIQADDAKITDEQFGKALGGEAIQAASVAFYDELISFFLGVGRRDVVRAITAQRNLIEKAVLRIEMDLGMIDLDKVIDETIGKLSTNLPGHAGLTPVP
jgi:hypothetical protein